MYSYWIPGHGGFGGFFIVSQASKDPWDWLDKSTPCEWWSWGAQADTTALSHMTGLNRDQSLIAHFQVWRISLELHWLTPNTASLELISYWADNGLTQTRELHSICIKEVLDPGGVVWRWCALGRAKLVCECCGGRALATAHESLTSVWPEKKELST